MMLVLIAGSAHADYAANFANRTVTNDFVSGQIGQVGTSGEGAHNNLAWELSSGWGPFTIPLFPAHQPPSRAWRRW